MTTDQNNQALRETLKESDEIIDKIFDAIIVFKQKGNIIKKVMSLAPVFEEIYTAILAYKSKKADF